MTRRKPKRRIARHPHELSMRQRCAAAGIVPRTVVADDHGAVGVVLEVEDDGTFTVAFTRGRLRTCTLDDPIEILVGPREWHAGRYVVLEDWRHRPAQWPSGQDDASEAFTLELLAKIDELAAERGFKLGEDLHVSLIVRRPRVAVPAVLELTPDEALEVTPRASDLDADGRPWRVPYTNEPATYPPVVEDGTRGRVYLKMEMDDGGPVWLTRGDRTEPLFCGQWVTVEQARDYALEHGHDFDAW